MFLNFRQAICQDLQYVSIFSLCANFWQFFPLCCSLRPWLFGEKKTIIIKRASDKIVKVISELNEKNIEDTKIIINSDNLEKKSKLRTYFEKHKSFICVAFYPDNVQTLTKLESDFFKKKNILISHENINQIINKSNGDRKNLLDELEKINLFCLNVTQSSKYITIFSVLFK